MPTVQDFINSTLRLIRVLDSGETPTPTESADALTSLNQLITSWAAAGVPIYQEEFDVIPLTGASQYALSRRPVKLQSAQVNYGGITFPVSIVTSQQWTLPKDRSATSHFAKELYYDGGYPNGNIYLWPTVSGSTLQLFVLRGLPVYANLTDTINLPPGYEQALRFALAGVLAPEYGTALPPEYQQAAAEAKANIATMNATVIAQAPPATALPAAI